MHGMTQQPYTVAVVEVLSISLGFASPDEVAAGFLFRQLVGMPRLLGR